MQKEERPTFVKINLKCWARELWSHLSEKFNPDETEYYNHAAACLIEEFVEWAAKQYAGQDVAAAVDMADTFVTNGKFISRGETESDLEWDTQLRFKTPLFWNNEHMCLNDGYTD